MIKDNNVDRLVFDLDSWMLDGFVLGEKTEKIDESSSLLNAECGYEVYAKDSKVTGIFVCLRDGYRDCKKFNGLFLKNNKYIDSFESFKPNDVVEMFGSPSRSWDDGSEVSMEYKEGQYEFEFVWRIKESKVELNYVMVEL